MLDMKQFISAIDQIADEKGIPREKIVSTIEDAIAAAYKKDYGEKGQVIKANMNVETGEITLRQIQYVVEGVDEEGYITGELPYSFGDEKSADDQTKKKEDKKPAQTTKDVQSGGEDESNEEKDSEEEIKIKFNPEKHTLLEDAKKEKKSVKVGDEIIISLESKTDFGRVAAQTAKQVIIQRLREVEREVIFEEFTEKEGDVISGIVQRKEGAMIFIDLGKTNGLLVPTEQMPNDLYRIGQRLRFLILRVEKTNRGPAIILSRSHSDLVYKLFEFEVPEIESDSVEIKSIAREAGFRSKIAVASNEDGVDPIGSLVGQRGVRVQTVINELSGEKVDIIEWEEDITKYISNALLPAKTLNVKILDEENKHALAEVDDDQFSLAIGKRGQNVRLAAKLTGWKIDVRSPMEKMSTEEDVEMKEELDVSSEEKKSDIEKTEEVEDKNPAQTTRDIQSGKEINNIEEETENEVKKNDDKEEKTEEDGK